MAFNHFINMIFLFIVHVLFFLTGMCLNSLVILSFWRYTQLRKKTSHFMILVLSCCDLLAVVTNHSLMAVIPMLWLTGKLNIIVMNIDRYLATSYPIFHRKSVTKGSLLTVFVMLILVEIILDVLCIIHVLSYQKGLLIFLVTATPPIILINCKLFIIVRKNRRSNEISPRIKKRLITNISSCLLAIACFVVLSIPAFVYIGLKTSLNMETFNLDDADVVGIWSKTIASMNSTFNCLIFYWKNKTLRTEGMKIIRSLQKNRVQVFSDH